MNRLLIALVTVLHLIPHPFGVSPIGATALYSGAYGSNRISWTIPLIPLIVAALIFGFYEPVVMAFVFGGFALSTFAGRWLLRGERTYGHYALAVPLGATIFFLVSNFSQCLVGYYPLTPAGVLQCYVNGLPYLGQAMLADGAYCFLLFGLHSMIEWPETEPVHA